MIKNKELREKIEVIKEAVGMAHTKQVVAKVGKPKKERKPKFKRKKRNPDVKKAKKEMYAAMRNGRKVTTKLLKEKYTSFDDKTATNTMVALEKLPGVKKKKAKGKITLVIK